MAELITLTGFSMHQRLGLFALLAVEVARSAHGQMSAGWVRDHQIPAAAKHVLNWRLIVPVGVGFAIQQVAAPCVVAAAPEGITHPAAVFTGDEDAHQ
jgi:hypothetical protein